MEKPGTGTGVLRAGARVLWFPALILASVCPGCLTPGESTGILPLEVTSDAFAQDGGIPALHTCDGADISPPLSWSAVPPGTGSIAILVTDPDAPGGSFVHWVAYNLPPDTRAIPATEPGKVVLPAGSLQGTNDMGRAAYGGPCPPKGRPHHYHFTVSALDRTLDLTGTRDGRTLLGAMEGHVLARGEIVGIYQRS